MPRKKKKKTNKTPIIVLGLIFLFSVSFTLGLYSKDLIPINLQQPSEEKIQIIPQDMNFDGIEYTELRVPAVDNFGNGVATTLFVGITPGTGRTWVDIDGLLFWVDTQNSIRIAKNVAEEYTGQSLSDKNLIFKVEANASVIGGPSAGSALAIATIAAVQGDKLRPDVMITGSVNHDGTIGPVGGIVEKANAAKLTGANLFLVPLLQGTEVLYEQREHCELYGGVEFCSIETVPKKVSVSGEAGINIEEVQTIGDAYGYFVSQTA